MLRIAEVVGAGLLRNGRFFPLQTLKSATSCAVHEFLPEFLSALGETEANGVCGALAVEHLVALEEALQEVRCEAIQGGQVRHFQARLCHSGYAVHMNTSRLAWVALGLVGLLGLMFAAGNRYRVVAAVDDPGEDHVVLMVDEWTGRTWILNLGDSHPPRGSSIAD